ncbi:multidrug effflux MFS transporter [Rhodobacter ferrooxidans]|uniref:Drug resistance transporter, Bcr/CflA subfamily n=1 Tax=Rhodobacter ferrooxidans TaxID=371731 RepID=C8RZ40_9RHOB|nr:multidrug effflux MFS transporter [Rhodobacter sp. SW2]EEW25997.1 drug resistance transporter, Bcr/CflA subfamily [Rhodobacter sp. SW2]
MSTQRLSQAEFIAMLAMLFATVAFSIDAMLPALPEIAAELTPDAPNAAQLILTSFVLGMGLGTLFVGPLSDTFGRKPVILAGAALYSLAALAAWVAPTLETMLLARMVQGLGAAAPRIVSLALVRDLYRGREMARVVSIATMFFTLVPAVAPALGMAIIAGFGWRAIFLAFVLFSAVSILWLHLRQAETLPPPLRRPLHFTPLLAALREVLSHRVIVLAIAVQTLCFAALFGTLSSTQQVFDQHYGMAATFPYWFAGIALAAGSASLLNARLVVRLGMRHMVTVTLAVQMLASTAMALLTWAGMWPATLDFPAYLLWTCGVFFMTGLTIGNLNALALEPVGHIAGMAASVSGAIATVASVAIAVPVGLAFDGTAVPLQAGVAVFAGLGWLLMRRMPH